MKVSTLAGISIGALALLATPHLANRMKHSGDDVRSPASALEFAEDEKELEDDYFASVAEMEKLVSAEDSEDSRKESRGKPGISPETAQALRDLRAKIRSWAPHCEDGSLTYCQCPFGDALEYMGMLCLSGDDYYCDQVRRAQGPDGMFWRTPGFVGKDDPNSTSAPFSRDMSRGAWAYIIAKQDREVARRWMDYIKNNDFKMCPKRKKGFDACKTRAGYWTFATEVFDWLKLPRVKKMKDYKFVVMNVYDPVEARLKPRGYQLLLTGEAIYSLYEMEKRGAKLQNRRMLERMSRIIHRREPENPFYEYLVDGATESAAKKVLKYCPSEKPTKVDVTPEGDKLYHVEWGHPIASKRYLQGGGHMCIFLMNVLLGGP